MSCVGKSSPCPKQATSTTRHAETGRVQLKVFGIVCYICGVDVGRVDRCGLRTAQIGTSLMDLGIDFSIELRFISFFFFFFFQRGPLTRDVLR